MILFASHHSNCVSFLHPFPTCTSVCMPSTGIWTNLSAQRFSRQRILPLTSCASGSCASGFGVSAFCVSATFLELNAAALKARAIARAGLLRFPLKQIWQKATSSRYFSKHFRRCGNVGLRVLDGEYSALIRPRDIYSPEPVACGVDLCIAQCTLSDDRQKQPGCTVD